MKSYDAKQELLASEIWKGDSNSIKLGTEEAIWLTIPRGTADDITADIEVPELLMAPIAAGEKIGTIQLTLNGDTVATKPLIALESVEEGGLFKRLWHWLVLMIKGLFS